ncbi:MAG: PilZ domain-containing protein [Candidatus Omnitrophota bacterium]|nr:PilZ domain-containing protein [Candidatus Omnitrophota bacterium]
MRYAFTNMDYSGIEKRRFIRARFPCKITIYAHSQRIISTHTENISAGGIRVIIGEKIQVSSSVGLEIELKDNTIICKGRIVWIVDKESPYRKGVIYHDTGIEFHDIKEQDRQIIHNFIEEIISQKS